jgi:hypothetical protein
VQPGVQGLGVTSVNPGVHHGPLVHATGLRLSLGLGLALVFVHLRYGIANNGFLVGWVVVRMMCGQRESGLTGVIVDQGHG